MTQSTISDICLDILLLARLLGSVEPQTRVTERLSTEVEMCENCHENIENRQKNGEQPNTMSNNFEQNINRIIDKRLKHNSYIQGLQKTEINTGKKPTLGAVQKKHV